MPDDIAAAKPKSKLAGTTRRHSTYCDCHEKGCNDEPQPGGDAEKARLQRYLNGG